MFKRIIYDDWTSFVPLISFWFTFGVFLIITVRALLLKKEKVRHLENLPLEDEPNSTPAIKES
jgi:membrane protein implicated in regulation of membrane protease activity